MTEIQYLREIVNQVQRLKDQMFFDIVPNDCGCKGAPTKRVFRTPEIFSLSALIDQYNVQKSKGFTQ